MSEIVRGRPVLSDSSGVEQTTVNQHFRHFEPPAPPEHARDCAETGSALPLLASTMLPHGQGLSSGSNATIRSADRNGGHAQHGPC